MLTVNTRSREWRRRRSKDIKFKSDVVPNAKYTISEQGPCAVLRLKYTVFKPPVWSCRSMTRFESRLQRENLNFMCNKSSKTVNNTVEQRFAKRNKKSATWMFLRVISECRLENCSYKHALSPHSPLTQAVLKIKKKI